jgi:hypothetical protein
MTMTFSSAPIASVVSSDDLRKLPLEDRKARLDRLLA